jgi:carotenoid cleavage dioxygenase
MASTYLTGPYAPVHDELTVGDLPVRGALPAGLEGSYLRNGPNPQFPPLGRYHPFDGDGMIHAVDLRGGRARYRNRYVASKGLLAERRAGRALYGGLSEFQLPPPELAAEAGMLKNTANTNVVRHAGRVLGLMEACPPTELSAGLDTLGELDFGGALAGPMTAHPKTDPVTGELVFFGYGPFPPYLRYHVADRSGALVTSVDIDLPGPVMMHDFAVSARRVAFFDLPAVFDVEAMMHGQAGIRWAPEHGARIGVLDRVAPEAGVRWIEVEPFFVFHFLNAYDDGDTMVVDGCRSSRMTVAFGDEVMPEGVMPALHRWRIDLAAGRVDDHPLDDRPADFPRVNDRFAGLPARFGYVGHTRPAGGEALFEFDGVTKHDLVTGTDSTHSYGPTAFAGEATFAADPDRDGEDGGWLLSLVHDKATDESSLVIVDAETLAEVARVLLPRRVPFGFHGNWMPSP